MPVSARYRTSRYPQGIAKATGGPPLTGEPDLEVLVCWGALHPRPGHSQQHLPLTNTGSSALRRSGLKTQQGVWNCPACVQGFSLGLLPIAQVTSLAAMEPFQQGVRLCFGRRPEGGFELAVVRIFWRVQER